MSDPFVPRYTEVQLDRRRVGASIAVTREVRYSVDADIMRDQLVHRLESFVLAHQLDAQVQTHTEEVPATWWQHFKLEAIRWGNPLFNPAKVRMRSLTLTTRFQPWVNFPDPQIAYPDILGPTRIAIEAHNRRTP